jgi:DNA-binding CsgD family transcriptional regulator
LSDEDTLDKLRLPVGVLLGLAQTDIRTIGQLRQCSDAQMLALPRFEEWHLKAVRRQLALYEAASAQESLHPATRPPATKRKAQERFSPSRPRGPQPGNPQREHLILVLHLQGKTPREIGLEVGLSRQQVYIYLARLDCKPNLGQHPAILAAHQQGLLPAEIAALLQIPRSSVYHALKTLGLTPHRANPQTLRRRSVWEKAKQGLTSAEIAVTLGMTEEEVETYLQCPGN